MTHRFFIGIVLLLFSPGIFSAFLRFGGIIIQRTEWLTLFLLGSFFGVVFDLAIVRKVSVLDTFRHELTHAFAAMMFFRRVNRFVVTRYSGGGISWDRGFGGELADDIIIGLAPYTIPTLYLISVLVRPLLSIAWFPWFDVWVGFAFGFHLWGGLRDIKWNWSKQPLTGAWSGNQTDIAYCGYVFSFIYIITVSLAIHGILLSVMLKGYGGIISWGQQFWSVTQGVIDLIPKVTNFVN
jgi:hypothetical protein